MDATSKIVIQVTTDPMEEETKAANQNQNGIHLTVDVGILPERKENGKGTMTWGCCFFVLE